MILNDLFFDFLDFLDSLPKLALLLLFFGLALLFYRFVNMKK